MSMSRKTKVPILSDFTPRGLLVIGLICFATAIIIIGGILLALMVFK